MGVGRPSCRSEAARWDCPEVKNLMRSQNWRFVESPEIGATAAFWLMQRTATMLGA